MKTKQINRRVPKALLDVSTFLLVVSSLALGLIVLKMGPTKINHGIIFTLSVIDVISLITFILLWGLREN